MGQTRTDSNQQLAAKVNRAARTQCPKCGRKGALTRRNLSDDVIVACRWALQGKCDYVKMREQPFV